jgi:hypothetical protein
MADSVAFVPDQELAAWVDFLSTRLDSRFVTMTTEQKATAIHHELTLMFTDWQGKDTRFLTELAPYGITDSDDLAALLRSGLEVLYRMVFAALAGRKGVQNVYEVYQAMGYDEVRMNLMTLLLVELIIYKTTYEIPRTLEHIHMAQERAAAMIRQMLAEEDKPMPEQML